MRMEKWKNPLQKLAASGIIQIGFFGKGICFWCRAVRMPFTKPLPEVSCAGGNPMGIGCGPGTFREPLYIRKDLVGLGDLSADGMDTVVEM